MNIEAAVNSLLTEIESKKWSAAEVLHLTQSVLNLAQARAILTD